MSTSPNSVVFITGTFISNNCWDEWMLYFKSEGYECIAPAWPHKDAPAEDLRNRSVVDDIASNTIKSLTDHFADVIGDLPGKPILIGHSLGGLVVQLLLQRDMAIAGVAIHSFPPPGVNRFRPSFLKAVWKPMMLLTSVRETYLMPFRTWKHTVANGIDCDQQKQLYYQYAIPESKQIVRDTFTWSAQIDFGKSHAPLLLTSGSTDHLVPAPLNYSNYKKYATGNSVTDYKDFEGHNHLVFGHPGWKEEADYILYWLRKTNY